MTTNYLPQCVVKIGGSAISSAWANALIEVNVDSSLLVPEMFSIKIGDPELELADDSTIALGATVEIDITTEGSSTSTGTLVTGEITAIEPHFHDSAHETTMVIRGYSLGHRLHRGKKTRTFLSQTDSDVVSSLASEAGLTADDDFLIQNNQTDMEFLHARADLLGYQVWLGDGKLCFKSGETTLGTGPTLTFGTNLHTFRPALVGTHQADTMTVYGWDPKGKTQLTGSATPSSTFNQGGMTDTGGSLASSAFGGSATAAITDRPVFTTDEADLLATGLSDDIAREAMLAEGTCDGDPTLKAGCQVTVSGVGTRFSGSYLVTSATHIWNADGYVTNFSISGRKPNFISRLAAAADRDRSQGLMRGVVTGLVTNNKDADNLGRVKVKYAWLGDIESDWVRIASPAAGSTRGFYMLPEVNDEVLVAFEHGDPHRPYIVGVLWSNTDQPPEANSAAVGSDGKVNHRIIKSRSGHQIVLDDTDGSEKISIIDKTGNNTIVIDSANNKITISTGQDTVITASGKVSVTATGKMSLSSQDDVDISGNNVNISAQMNASLKGSTNCSIEGTTSLDLKGGTSATLHNDGGGSVAVSGPSVSINDGALQVT
jgi:phage protein D/phage baseplate assembly protein gpV